MKKESRHTCIVCGSKRANSKMLSFSFTSYLTPIRKSTTYHYCCKQVNKRFNQKCIDFILQNDYNVVVLPISKPQNVRTGRTKKIIFNP